MRTISSSGEIVVAPREETMLASAWSAVTTAIIVGSAAAPTARSMIASAVCPRHAYRMEIAEVSL